jgi:hypothetical protein
MITLLSVDVGDTELIYPEDPLLSLTLLIDLDDCKLLVVVGYVLVDGSDLVSIIPNFVVLHCLVHII